MTAKWIDGANRLSKLLHSHQIGKDGLPYYEHPRYVASQLRETKAKVVALLHDVVEDTPYSAQDIGEYLELHGDMIEALELLTHKKGVSYENYIKGICSNNIAIRVKIEDLKHNLMFDRIKDDDLRDKIKARNENKYKKALEVLEKLV